MNNFSGVFVRRANVIAAAVVIAFMAHNAIAAPVTLDARCAPQLRGMDQRLYDKAHESPASLRHYLSFTAGALSKDAFEATDWAAGIDRDRQRCIAAQAPDGLAPGDGR